MTRGNVVVWAVVRKREIGRFTNERMKQKVNAATRFGRSRGSVTCLHVVKQPAPRPCEASSRLKIEPDETYHYQPQCERQGIDCVHANKARKSTTQLEQRGKLQHREADNDLRNEDRTDQRRIEQHVLALSAPSQRVGGEERRHCAKRGRYGPDERAGPRRMDEFGMRKDGAIPFERESFERRGKAGCGVDGRRRHDDERRDNEEV